ncbi:MAG: hypothetical protein ACI4AA_08830 [Lachnospiraceae bacterium]
MAKFDREIKRLIRDVKPPETYEKKVDSILQSIEEQEEAPAQKRRNPKWVPRLALCLICIVGLLSITAMDVQANIFETFKATIMDFLGLASEEDAERTGVESERINNVSKRDLMMETQEVVVDSHMIYLLVEIRASSDIEFSGDVGFDYFCFCAGDNYNNENLLTGARSCELLEVNADKPYMATYIVSIAFEQELEEGSNVTAYFKDLERDPYSDDPKLLIEGMWSVTFPLNKTVTAQVSIEGNADMVFSYQNTTATVDDIEITPLGLVLNADVSNFPYEQLGLSDTTIAITLKMIDGTEQVIVSHKPGESFIQCGSTYYEQDGDKSYQQDTLEFTEVISLEKVCGIYIEDLYIPFE